jgi:thiol-disulfide isomerase/thioredoxin
MAHSIPLTLDTRTRRNRREMEIQEKCEEVTHYAITGTSLKRFVLSFFVLYGVLALSIFSVFALQDQSPVLVTQLLDKEIEPGEEVNFAIWIKNPSILEKEFTLVLEKELSEGWIASFCSETQCFYETCTTTIRSLKEQKFTVNFITDTTGNTGTACLSLYFEGTLQETAEFTVKTRKNPDFTVELTGNERTQHDVSFGILITNTGNVADVYTLSVPPGIIADVSEDTIELEPGEEKEVTVYIAGKQTVNTSLIITSRSGSSETLYLICEQAAKYDFELYSPREFYIDSSETEISLDVINMGDTSDTYCLNATCLAPGWEAICYPAELSIDPKKSDRLRIWVKCGEGKSTSVIITATSESGLTKNVKISIYIQETQGKTVLAEYFTGTWCYVCSYGERALRQLAEELDNLVVLVYHLKDDIETPGSQKRTYGVYGFTDTVSTLIINGTKHAYYSSGGEGAIYFRYKKIIEEMLSEPLKAEIYISGHTLENIAYVTAEIHSYSSGTYDVYFVLFKNNFDYRGSNTKQYIVRDVADPQNLYLPEGGETTVSCEFVLPAGDAEGYGIVVIIQDPETLEVLQANSYML